MAPLVYVLQMDLAAIVMGFLGNSGHSELLETCSRLRCSFNFVWGAATQYKFSFFKVCLSLRNNDALCRRAIEYAWRGQVHFRRLMISIPAEVRTSIDFMAYTTTKVFLWVAEFLDDDIRLNPEFCSALIKHLPPYDEEYGCDDRVVDYIPDGILASNRELALACARKGFRPFGSKFLLHVDDEEVIATYLRVQHRLPQDVVPALMQSAAWFTEGWILDMCSSWPETAPFMLEIASNSDVQAKILEAIPDDMVYKTLDENIGIDETFNRLWRRALQRDPNVIRLVGDWCDLRPEDEGLLTRFFSAHPQLYSQSHYCLRRLRYVARAVFSRDGRQIRDSRFIRDKEMALIAVQQNGMALKWLHEDLRKDSVILMAAVRQNGLALAWAWGHSYLVCRTDPVTQAAIEQNPGAAAFIDR